MNWFKSLLSHNKTWLRAAGTSVASSVVGAVVQGVTTGHVDARVVGLAALSAAGTIVAGLAKAPAATDAGSDQAAS